MERLYLKLEGILGEQKGPRHLGSFQIVGFTWASNADSNASTGRGSRLDGNITECVVTRVSDINSGRLMHAYTTARVFPEASVVREKLDRRGNPFSSTFVRFRGVLISAMSTEPRDGLEQITLNFESARFGGPGGSGDSDHQPSTWDIFSLGGRSIVR